MELFVDIILGLAILSLLVFILIWVNRYDDKVTRAQAASLTDSDSNALRLSSRTHARAENRDTVEPHAPHTPERQVAEIG